MDGEIDLDIFFTGEIIDDREPPEQRDLGAIAASEAERQEQLLRAPVAVEEAPVMSDRRFLRALIYVSHTGGEGHVVVLHETPIGQAVMCNCPATRSLNHRPRGCWAMVDARAILGLPPID